MIKTFIQQSGKVKELRETFNLCGKMYSGEYYNRLYENDEKNVRTKSYENNKLIALFRLEYIEVIESESGELTWKAVEQLPVHKSEFDFNSSLGLFQSCNRGEFGGILITPKNNIRGNFSNLFEFNNKVYAIDSLKKLLSIYSKVKIVKIHIFSPLGAIGIDKSCFAYDVDFLC